MQCCLMGKLLLMAYPLITYWQLRFYDVASSSLVIHCIPSICVSRKQPILQKTKTKKNNKQQQKPLLVFLGKGFTNTLKSPDDLFSPAGMLIVTIRFTFIST